MISSNHKIGILNRLERRTRFDLNVESTPVGIWSGSLMGGRDKSDKRVVSLEGLCRARERNTLE